jgi:FkbM family methyltransferase
VTTIQEIRRDAIIGILKDVEFPVVVEAGACHGEDSQMLTYAAAHPENITHVLIEPDPENCDVIRSKALDIKGRRLIQGALASTSGTRKFNRAVERTTGYRFCGSLLGAREGAFKQMSFDEIVDIQCYTLDEVFLLQNLTHIDLLWADVQGGERGMLEGGWSALAKTRYLFMEVEESEQYVGQALKSELISLLEQRGWAMEIDFETIGDVLMRNTRYQKG